MDKISIISYGEKTDEQICGYDIAYADSPKSRRKLKRFISRFHIKRVAVLGDAPDFVVPELARLGVIRCTGERLMQSIYPTLISRAAKTYKDCDFCTVYDTSADNETLKIIECAAEYFKYVALKTDAPAEPLAEKIMDSMGVALRLGEFEGVGILHRGDLSNKNIKINLTKSTKTTFADENKSIISPAVAEAIAGDDIDGAVLNRLNLKIHSLC